MLKPGSAFRGPEPTHIYKGEFVNGVKKGFGQFINSDFDAFYMGEVDNLPNGFGVVNTKEYFHVGFFKDGKFDGEGLHYNYHTEEGQYGTFKNNELMDGDHLTLTSDYADKELALCHVIDEKYDYKGICRNGVPGGLGYWVWDGEFGLYPSWGEYEIVDGVLNNHGFGMEYIHAEEEDYFYIGYWGANSPAGQGLLNDYLHQKEQFLEISATTTLSLTERNMPLTPKNSSRAQF